MKLLAHLSRSDALIADISGLFEERIVQGHTPALRYAIFDASGVVHEGGFGDSGTAGNPPPAAARFRIASCTKSFTAASILVLRDRGRLSLDDPVTRYVPALQPILPVSNPQAPTLRMLLSMSGGLPTDDPWADRQESLSAAAFDTVLKAGVRFASIPGTRFEYSNLGYALLGRVIEAVSGQTYPDFVVERLLTPLALTDTGFDPAAVPESRLATGFRRLNGGWEALPFTGPGAFSAIGGAITTVQDLARWAGWLGAAFRDEHGEAGPLSPASRREMQAAQSIILLGPGESGHPKGYGFGLNVEHDPHLGLIASHSGGYPGFSSHMRWSPQTGLGVIVFENATYSGAWVPATEALKRLLKAAISVHVPPPPPIVVQSLANGLRQLVEEGWSDQVAEAIFLDNVAMDRPYGERAAELADLRAKAGRLRPVGMTVRPADPGGADGGFGRFELMLDCAAGCLVAKAGCGPVNPMKIQSLSWTLEPKV